MAKKNQFVAILDEKLILKNKFENFEFILYSAMIFLVPFLLGHAKTLPLQLAVGTFVNALLVLGALYFGMKKVLPLIIIPSIAAFATGFVFGPLSFYLLYLIPFIWAGNFIYVYLIKLLKLSQKRNYFISIIAASTAKSALLFSATFVLFTFSVVPETFLGSMGILQLITAISGGIIAFSIYFLRH